MKNTSDAKWYHALLLLLFYLLLWVAEYDEWAEDIEE